MNRSGAWREGIMARPWCSQRHGVMAARTAYPLDLAAEFGKCGGWTVLDEPGLIGEKMRGFKGGSICGSSVTSSAIQPGAASHSGLGCQQRVGAIQGQPLAGACDSAKP